MVMGLAQAFYMRLNEDNKTVAAMDLLVPKVGELVGGSQREERLDVRSAGFTLRSHSSVLPMEPVCNMSISICSSSRWKILACGCAMTSCSP